MGVLFGPNAALGRWHTISPALTDSRLSDLFLSLGLWVVLEEPAIAVQSFAQEIYAEVTNPNYD
jgi:hypothetical protein